jgi:stearoyl-CoA desaturase (Delta-9 desaturase)
MGVAPWYCGIASPERFPVQKEPIYLVDRSSLNWPTTVILVLLHIGAVAALFFFNWKAFATAVVLYYIATGLGISMGYHRLHTHRSYNVPRWMEYFFAVCGTLTLEGGPIFWTAIHRIHHQKSDQPGDPHSPREGAWWSHVGWILVGETKHNNAKLLAKYAPDLAKDPFYLWLNDYHWVPSVLLAVGLYLVGGLPFLLWAGFFRIVFGLHATWLVNSATHMWGGRRFATRDDSRNNWWVALISFGEGWHNNHHAHPTSARHGLAWYEFDPSWLLIKVLKTLGLAKSIQVASVRSAVAEREAA